MLLQRSGSCSEACSAAAAHSEQQQQQQVIGQLVLCLHQAHIQVAELQRIHDAELAKTRAKLAALKSQHNEGLERARALIAKFQVIARLVTKAMLFQSMIKAQ